MLVFVVCFFKCCRLVIELFSYEIECYNLPLWKVLL